MGVGQLLCVFPFGIEGGIWDVNVLIPDHCFSIYYFYIRRIIISSSLVKIKSKIFGSF